MRIADDERGMEAVGRDEVRRLERPVREDAVHDLEAEGEPLRAAQLPAMSPCANAGLLVPTANSKRMRIAFVTRPRTATSAGPGSELVRTALRSRSSG